MSLDFLRQTSLQDLVSRQKQQIVTLHLNASLYDAIDVMTKNKVTALPIVDEDGDVYGSIDMLDLVSYLSKKLGGKSLSEKEVKEFISKQPIGGIMDISNRNAWHSIPSVKSLMKILPFLSHPNIHRVWTIGKDGKPNGVVTQMMLIDFLLNNADKAKNKMNQTLQEIFPESRQTVQISERCSLLEGFGRIYESRVSGIAIINENGKLIGNLSATDLKLLNFRDPARMLEDLKIEIGEFLRSKGDKEKLKKLFGEEEMPKTFEPVIAQKSDTLEKAMSLAKSNRVHRVYLTDQDNKPLFAISLGDLISQFY